MVTPHNGMDELAALRQHYRDDKQAVFAALLQTGASTRGVRQALHQLARLTDQTLRTLWQRAVLVVSAVMLIDPNLWTDLLGAAMAGGIAAMQLVARRRIAEAVPRPGE